MHDGQATPARYRRLPSLGITKENTYADQSLRCLEGEALTIGEVDLDGAGRRSRLAGIRGLVLHSLESHTLMVHALHPHTQGPGHLAQGDP
jgi:hypothetical protein